MTPAAAPPSPKRHTLRVADLSPTGETAFDIRFSPEEQRTAAETLQIPAVAKMRFQGRITPLGKSDWELRATVGATATQHCVLTLVPVKTRIDEDVFRIFRSDMPDYEDGAVVELNMDEHEEPLGEWIDLFGVAVEAIALALPPYPRAEGAELDQTVFAGDEVTPMTDEDAKPFASLAALKDKLRKE